MLRRAPCFCVGVCFALILGATNLPAFQGSEASSQAKTDQAQGTDQEKNKDQEKKGDQAKENSSKPADSSVFVLKAPEPPAQPQFAPELRPVDLEVRKRLDGMTRNHLIQLLDAELV